nr:MAG TPA: hypothetical protein [Caudoviricetes sp.]
MNLYHIKVNFIVIDMVESILKNKYMITIIMVRMRLIDLQVDH